MTPAVRASHDPVPGWRRKTARVILVVAALGAIFAFVIGLSSIRSVSPDVFVTKSWRLFGLLVFAGLFLLLAYRPRQYPGVWELVIFHKAVTAVFVGVFASVGATTTVIADSVLAAALFAAYLLVRGYENWTYLREPFESAPRESE